MSDVIVAIIVGVVGLSLVVGAVYIDTVQHAGRYAPTDCRWPE